jgi:heparosan-N-sulfate-glucuronate 5-epimerase
MSNLSRRRSLWRSLPLIADWAAWQNEVNKPRYRLVQAMQQAAELPLYPIDFAHVLSLPYGTLDEKGVPYNAAKGESPACYQPTTIAHYALAHWNAYRETADERHRQAFLTQARWLVEHDVRLDSEASAWPIPFPSSSYSAPGPWLSAMTQGMVISVLVRAYRLTSDEAFLTTARRGVCPFERDILDGGVSAFLEKGDVFFEEVAVYPAAHILNGYLYALFGLYDYVALTNDADINELIQRSLATLHRWMDGYDTGYWSRYDLFNKHQAPLFYHDLHVHLLRALAQFSGCAHCAELAARWEHYEQRAWCRFRHLVASRLWRYRLKVQRAIFGKPTLKAGEPLLICVPMPSFPLPGGIGGILAGIEETMAGEWHIERFTFGSARSTPAHFLSVWLAVFSGWRVLLSALIRRRSHYPVILARDGVFTGACAALAAKLAGRQLVCVEQGTVTWLTSGTYRVERLQSLQGKPWPVRAFSRLLSVGYGQSLWLLARLTARCVDCFLVADEDIAETYHRQFGVDPGRIKLLPSDADALRRSLRQATFWWTPPAHALYTSALEPVTAGDRE